MFKHFSKPMFLAVAGGLVVGTILYKLVVVGIGKISPKAQSYVS